LSAVVLLILGVPYWLAFVIFTGLVAIVPFFGTLVSTLLPALFVVASGDWVKVVLVILLAILIHVFEANVVVPRIMQHKVELPPVLTISSVLVMEHCSARSADRRRPGALCMMVLIDTFCTARSRRTWPLAACRARPDGTVDRRRRAAPYGRK
jgi:hypothetical protein